MHKKEVLRAFVRKTPLQVVSIKRFSQVNNVLIHQRKIAFSPVEFLLRYVLAGMQQQLLCAGCLRNGICHQAIGKLNKKNNRYSGFITFSIMAATVAALGSASEEQPG